MILEPYYFLGGSLPTVYDKALLSLIKGALEAPLILNLYNMSYLFVSFLIGGQGYSLSVNSETSACNVSSSIANTLHTFSCTYGKSAVAQS